jgi:hypothetical protein
MAPPKVGGGTYDAVRVSSPSLGTGTTDNTNTMLCQGDPAVLPEEALKNEALPFTRPPNQMTHASFLSRIFVHWPYPLLKLGLERTLEEVLISRKYWMWTLPTLIATILIKYGPKKKLAILTARAYCTVPS